MPDKKPSDPDSKQEKGQKISQGDPHGGIDGEGWKKSRSWRAVSGFGALQAGSTRNLLIKNLWIDCITYITGVGKERSKRRVQKKFSPKNRKKRKADRFYTRIS